MRDGPAIHYAREGSVHIAYQVFGAECPDLLVLSSAMLPIDSMDEELSLARFHRRLASFSRVIRFDHHGVGLSDPVTGGGAGTHEQWAQDALIVLDDVGSQKTVVLAPRDSSLEGIVLAGTHPERVSGLVVINGTARVARADDYPIGWPRRILDRFLEVNMEPEAVAEGFDFLALAAPSVAHDESFRSWWVKAGYRGASPTAARTIQEAILRADVRSLLPDLRVPVLVLHRVDNDFTRVAHGRYIAEHVPDARYVELPGADDLYWVGDTTGMLDEIEEFVTGTRGGPGAERILATILFTDIVGSTTRLAAMGDRQWRDLLETYQASLHRELARFGGRQIDRAGDGTLSTFDGPARAITCACAIRDTANQLGLDIRAGLHTGEVQIKGGEIAGMAVHIAARVQAAANPGQVLVTRTVVDVVFGSGIEFRPRGHHVLKGVPGRWQLYSVER